MARFYCFIVVSSKYRVLKNLLEVLCVLILPLLTNFILIQIRKVTYVFRMRHM